ncbi:hypothetical protein NIL06_20700 [Klebsiella pneumoniae]|uniref:hypothetical protein n=1 Tax=Klebsiella pneumoniae TaxID=573 RepID=UPI0021F7DECB|nr:hypothetical protein [Klebsiella pneumoniae]MCW0288995.1 hypothetical protein [Klebsiella pneumoniae]HBQ5956931.1 hypothetical protein [Klebsiella pneumoniae subsp. pneumoniae]
MGKNALVISRELSKDMEFAGQFLFKKLSVDNLPIDAAMWFLYPDQSWKYILIISDLAERGPTDVYKKISIINRNTPSQKYRPIPLEYIEAKDKNFFIYNRMKGFARISSSKVRVSNSMINGLEITDCLIYEFK